MLNLQQNDYNIVHYTQIMLPHYLEKLKCSYLLHFVATRKNALLFNRYTFSLYVHRFW